MTTDKRDLNVDAIVKAALEVKRLRTELQEAEARLRDVYAARTPVQPKAKAKPGGTLVDRTLALFTTQKELTAADVAKALGVTPEQAKRTLSGLFDSKRARRVRPGVYVKV